MAEPVPAPPPANPTYVVSSVTYIGQDLYQLMVQFSDGRQVHITMKQSDLSLANIYLAVGAVVALAQTRDGATPALRLDR